MQKISSYLYPNRIILTADLAGFITEYKNVYQRTVKIYQGVDNILEFDIKNADQKRIELSISPVISDIRLNVMDSQGNALPNSPYDITPLSTVLASATNAIVVGSVGKTTTTTITVPTANIIGTFAVNYKISGTAIKGDVFITSYTSDIDSGLTVLNVSFGSQTINAETGVSLSSTSEPIKGIAKAVIPSEDLMYLDHQFLRYSVTATKDTNTVLLYADSRFGATGTIELMTTAMPICKSQIIYDRFSGEINYMGNVIYHTSAVSTKFYEAVPTETITFTVHYTNFAGNLYIEGTEDSTIAVESFRNAPRIQTLNITTKTTGATTFTVSVGKYNYMRVSWLYPDVWQYSATGQDPTVIYGSVDTVTVTP